MKMAWDDEYLYVSFRCEDTNVTAVHTERDSPVYAAQIRRHVAAEPKPV